MLPMDKKSVKRRVLNKGGKTDKQRGEMYIQGVRLERSESYCLLLIKYEIYEFFNPTGGSPDVVHPFIV